MVFISYGSCDRQIAEKLTHYLEEPGITSVTFRGNGQEQLAGMASVVFDDNGKPVVWGKLNNVDQMQ